MELFVNDDACGDWVVPLGYNGLELQAVNAASALLFVCAGVQLLWKVEAPIARAYGFMMSCVGVGSFSFHATTSLSGFMVDIVPMAVTAALMLFRAMHALQADAGQVGPDAESLRFVVAMGSAFVAVYTPWVMMVAGVSHYTVWGVWALLFGSMGAIFGVVALMVFFKEGVMHTHHGRDLVVAIAAVLLGLGCSIHSFIPGMCEGWRTHFPFHAVWHLFSSVTANRCGHVLDYLTTLVSHMESDVSDRKRRSGNSLLVRLMKRDFLPSQFSM